MTTTTRLSAVPDFSESPDLHAISEEARSATLAANLSGARRLEAASRLVDQMARLAESAECGEGSEGDPRRPAHARLDPQARARDHLVAACQLTCWHAARLVTAGVQVHSRLPRMLSMLGRGLLPEQLAIDIACQLATVPDEIISEVERAVLARIGHDLHGGDRSSRSAVKGMIDREVEQRDPEAAKAAEEAAAETRTVRFRRSRNGMVSMWATLPGIEAELLRQRIEAEAQAAAGDGLPGTIDQLRADALCALAVYAPSAEPETVDGIELGEVQLGADLPRPTLGNAAAAAGQPIRISVIAAAARGAPNQVEFVSGAYASYEWLCRELLESGDEARVRFELIDPVPGSMDDPERALRYTISPALAERIRLRDGTCRHPGCEVEARDCDIDHVIAFDREAPELGGPTMEWNLVCLCRKHHREKTFGGARYRTGPLGELVIATESGHLHRTRPTGPLARAREGIQAEIDAILADRMIGPDGYISNPPGTWRESRPA